MMNIEEYYATKYDKYQQTLEKHNHVMLRAVSVTDDILREQLQEEYLRIADELVTYETEYKSIEPSYTKFLAALLLIEFDTFYANNFVDTQLSDILLTQGLDLSAVCKELRMRPIVSLNQKRELCLLMNATNGYLRVIDYQGYTAEIIGKSTNDKEYIVRCRGFSSLGMSNTCVILKEY